MQDWIEKRKDDPAYAPSVAVLHKLLSKGPPATDEEFQADMNQLLPWYFSDVTKAEVMKRDMADGGTLPSVYGFQTNLNDMKEENKLPHVADAGKVTAKTLILWGAEDSMCSQQAAHAIGDGIKDSKLVIIPGVGHMCWLENPTAFWTEVHEFLKI